MFDSYFNNVIQYYNTSKHQLRNEMRAEKARVYYNQNYKLMQVLN